MQAHHQRGPSPRESRMRPALTSGLPPPPPPLIAHLHPKLWPHFSSLRHPLLLPLRSQWQTSSEKYCFHCPMLLSIFKSTQMHVWSCLSVSRSNRYMDPLGGSTTSSGDDASTSSAIQKVVILKVPPTIIMLGSSSMTIPIFTIWSDPGDY